VLHAVGFVWVHDKDLGAGIVEIFQPFAQLRGLPVADRSGVAVDEDDHDGFLAAKVAQPVLLVECIG
jgi:hypothetical protein